MSDKPYRIFVTHLWQDDNDDDYLRVFDYLSAADNFYYDNYSKPDALKDAGATTDARELYRSQIQNAEVVIALAGQFLESPELINEQLRIVHELGKPLMVLEPFGVEETPAELVKMTKNVCVWQSRLIMATIKRLARGGEQQQFDVIDLPDDF